MAKDIIDTLHPEGSLSDNFYPNIKPANIPNGAITTDKLNSDVYTTFVTTETDQTIAGQKTFTAHIKNDEIDNTNGNAMLRYKSTENKVVLGGSTIPTTIMGSGDRPKYSKDGADFEGEEIALSKDITSLAYFVTSNDNINNMISYKIENGVFSMTLIDENVAFILGNTWDGTGSIHDENGNVFRTSTISTTLKNSLAGMICLEKVSTHHYILKNYPYNYSISNETFLLGYYWANNIVIFSQTKNIYNYNLFINNSYYAIGDSITAGVNANGKQYFTYFKNLCGFSSIQSDGIGGSCISTGEANDFISRLAKIPSSVNVLSFFGGTNDWGHHHTLGSMENTSSDTSTMYGALKYICEYMSTNFPTTAYFFITPIQRNCDVWPADNMSKGVWTNNLGYKLDDYVQAIIDVANYYSVPVIDLFHNTFNGHSQQIVTTYLTDGLHPNEAGHKIMSRKISKFINNIL